MPQLRLEYSKNRDLGKEDSNALFLQLHQVLVNTAGAELLHCQSRAICCENFCIGEGSEERAFVYLEVLLLQGRTEKQLQETGKELLNILHNQFKHEAYPCPTQISVHLNEILPIHYYKSICARSV